MKTETILPAPLTVDLRGKSLDEVLSLLRSAGFTLKGTADMTDCWDFYAPSTAGKPGPRAQVVWIEDREAHLLTVTLFSGKTITLEPGKDLHLFDGHRPDGQRPGQDWGAYKTLNIMR